MRNTQLTASQTAAYNYIMKGRNVFLTGHAGTGKSFLLRKVIHDLEHQGKHVIVAAPTGIAAMNVGGTTLHRLFQLRPDIYIKKKEQVPPVLKETDVLFIDEISMCRIDLFEYIGKVLKKTKRRIQVVVIGDFCQLPPVLIRKKEGTGVDEKAVLDDYFGFDVGGGYAFLAPQWKRLNFKTVQLEEVVRQSDPDFIQALDMVRVGDPRALGYFENNSSQKELPGGIYISGRNLEVDRLNAEKMGEIQAPSFFYEAVCKGEVGNEEKRVAPERLELKIGARVMTTVSDSNGEYSNGSLGYVTRLGHKSICVQIDDGEEVEIGKNTWEIVRYELEEGKEPGKMEFHRTVAGTYIQYPVKPAWAITIHKSQGQTFDQVNLNPNCWDSGQLYVALSRVKTIEGLHLSRPLYARYLKLDPAVTEFYRTVRTEEPEDAGFARDMVYEKTKTEKMKTLREDLQIPEETENENQLSLF